jgi:predicted membrane metal-binding protein
VNRLAGSVEGRWAAAGWGVFALGIGVGFLAAPSLGALWFMPGLAVAVAVVVGVVAGRTGMVLVAIVVLLGLLGMLRGATAAAQPGPGRIDGHLGTRSVVVTGTVRESIPGRGAEAVVDAERVVDADTESRVSGGLLVIGSNLPAVAPGDRVEIDATGLRAPGRRPGPESEAALERRDIQAIAVAPLMSVLAEGSVSLPRWVAGAQARLVDAVDGVLPEPAAALVLGVAFGVHRPLAGDVRTPLQDAGLIHIVVISGVTYD